jgi:hypothetical protein
MGGDAPGRAPVLLPERPARMTAAPRVDTDPALVLLTRSDVTDRAVLGAP